MLAWKADELLFKPSFFFFPYSFCLVHVSTLILVTQLTMNKVKYAMYQNTLPNFAH